MAKCNKCKINKKKAVLLDPPLCKEHFIKYFEARVHKTIKQQKLFTKDSKVCVAASGGKDSLTVLNLTNQYLRPGNCTALIIDEGINHYRAHTLTDLKNFCTKNNIPLKIISFKKEFGKTLDQIIKQLNEKPCTVCGILRRYLLNKYSRGFDFLATGHNLDDEAQAIMMNIFRDQLSILSRLGPISGTTKDEKFVQRVKPLYFCPEKEVALYAILKGFNVSFTECPYVTEAYRADIRDFLNTFDTKTKFNTVNYFLTTLPTLKLRQSTSKLQYCTKCGEPSASKICNACRLVAKINKQ